MGVVYTTDRGSFGWPQLVDEAVKLATVAARSCLVSLPCYPFHPVGPVRCQARPGMFVDGDFEVPQFPSPHYFVKPGQVPIRQ